MTLSLIYYKLAESYGLFLLDDFFSIVAIISSFPFQKYMSPFFFFIVALLCFGKFVPHQWWPLPDYFAAPSLLPNSITSQTPF